MKASTENVLVTGAGSGIGRELAKLFLADGARVWAVGLVERELDELKRELTASGDRLVTLPRDLSAPDAAKRLIETCDAAGFEIDALVNNAGFATFGDFVDTDSGRLEAMIALNIVTLTNLCRIVGARMKARGSGGILNVGSIAGMVPAARFAAYGATKAYVNQFSFALRAELRPYGVNVTCLTPGATQSGFAQAAGIATFDRFSMLKLLFARRAASSPAHVARAGYRGFRNRHAQVLVGRGALTSGLVSHLLPLRILPALLRHL